VSLRGVHNVSLSTNLRDTGPLNIASQQVTVKEVSRVHKVSGWRGDKPLPILVDIYILDTVENTTSRHELD
jgi:hypothetical protein